MTIDGTLQREFPGEHGQTSKASGRLLVQQLVAPRQRRPHRRCQDGGLGADLGVAQLVEDLPGRAVPELRADELEGKGQSVETVGDLRQRSQVLPVGGCSPACTIGARDQQVHGVVLGQGAEVVDRRPALSERLATRRPDGEIQAAVQQPVEDRRDGGDARTDQRHQPPVQEQPAHPAEVVVTADEGCGQRGQVVVDDPGDTQRREVGAQTGRGDLEQHRSRLEATEAVLPEPLELPVGIRGLGGGRCRHDDLLPVSGRRTGVVERREEAVSLGLDDDPSVLPDRAADDAVVALELARVPRAQTVEERGRTLDVGEDEGDRACGERPHHLMVDGEVDGCPWFPRTDEGQRR